MIYLSGGMLGDFIQQLSIIYENYLENKEKAILYISNKERDPFRFPIEKVYEDTKDIIMNQPYIKEYKIHQGEDYDVNLSIWRDHGNLFTTPFIDNIRDVYHIEWGLHKWLMNLPIDDNYKEYIVINTTNYRFPVNIDWQKFMEDSVDKHILFVGFDKEQYDFFIDSTKCKNIPFYQVSSLFELCIIINSCSLFIGSLSAPLSIAFALYTKCVIGYHTISEGIFRHMSINLPNIQNNICSYISPSFRHLI